MGMGILKTVGVALYVVIAMAVYAADRRVGDAKCWNSSFNNSEISSILTAATWPMFAILIGTVSVITAQPIPQYLCLAKQTAVKP